MVGGKRDECRQNSVKLFQNTLTIMLLIYELTTIHDAFLLFNTLSRDMLLRHLDEEKNAWSCMCDAEVSGKINCLPYHIYCIYM